MVWNLYAIMPQHAFLKPDPFVRARPTVGAFQTLTATRYHFVGRAVNVDPHSAEPADAVALAVAGPVDPNGNAIAHDLIV